MRKAIGSLLILALGCGALPAQRPEPAPDPLQRHLFPPELIMRNQRVLQLTPEQRDYIVDQVQEAQRQFTGHQWKLQLETETLAALLSAPAVDEDQTLEQLEKILALEKEIKKTHLLLALRIRNSLTADQRRKLDELRERMGPRPERPGSGRSDQNRR